MDFFERILGRCDPILQCSREPTSQDDLVP